ncbi:MAG: tetratricopeptide repeat protein [Planctomycetota bacterium]
MTPPQESEAVAAAVARALSAKQHLLVLDDVPDLAAARQQYALADPARLLVTTRRNAATAGGFRTFPLDVLNAYDARALLRQKRGDLAGDEHDAALDAVTGYLHRHALAVALANSYLRENPDLSPAALLAELERAPIGEDEGLLGDVDPRDVDPRYRRGVAATLMLHLPTLGQPENDADRLRQRLLAAASLLDPRAIPRDLLHAAVPDVEPREARKQLNRLVDVSVLRATANDAAAVDIHGLSQQIVKARLVATKQGRQLVGRSAHNLRNHLIGVFTNNPVANATRGDILDNVSRHASALIRQNLGRHIAFEWAILCNLVGYHAQRVHHRLRDALKLFSEAERIDRVAFGDDHHLVAQDVNNAGGVLHALRDLSGALVLYRESERILRLATGVDRRNLGMAINNIGGVLRELDDLPNALVAFREAECVERAAFGNNHQNVAVCVNNIGSVLLARGDADGALKAFSEAERIDRVVFGSSHTNVAIRLGNVGRALLLLGKHEDALAAYCEAEQLFRAAFGNNHPSIAIAANNVATAWRASGHLDVAMSNFREAERIDRAAFGDSHPNVATRINNIGDIFMLQGHLDDALDCFVRSERVFSTYFGEMHSNVTTGINSIASVHAARGDHREARMSFTKALCILLRLYGPTGMNVDATAANLLAVDGNPVGVARDVAGDDAAEAVRAGMMAILPREGKAKLAALEGREP